MNLNKHWLQFIQAEFELRLTQAEAIRLSLIVRVFLKPLKYPFKSIKNYCNTIQ